MSNLGPDPYEVAEEQGLVVVVPEHNELQVDLDDGQSFERLKRTMACLDRNGVKYVASSTNSRSGRVHMHVTLDPDSTSLMTDPVFGGPVMRIALQACLGSDPVRELLSLLRLVHRSEMPATLFFEKKDAVRVPYVLPLRSIRFGRLEKEPEDYAATVQDEG